MIKTNHTLTKVDKTVVKSNNKPIDTAALNMLKALYKEHTQNQYFHMKYTLTEKSKVQGLRIFDSFFFPFQICLGNKAFPLWCPLSYPG